MLGDKHGFLYRFDKRLPEKGVFKTIPKNNFVENHLYDQHDEDGNVETSAEEVLADLDGRARTVIQKIVEAVRAGELPDLTVDEKATWDMYYYTLFKRTSDAMKRMHLTDDEIAQILSRVIVEHQLSGGKAVTPKERANLFGSKMRQTARVSGILQIGEAFLAINNCGFDIAVVRNSDGCLTIGDNPIINFNLCKPKRVIVPPLEGWLPISHDVAVRPAFARSEGYSLLVKDEHFRDLLNKLMLRQSTTIVGRYERVVESISRNLVQPSG